MTYEGSRQTLILELHPLAHHDDGQRAQVPIGEPQRTDEQNGPEVVGEEPPFNRADDERESGDSQHGEHPNVLLGDDAAVVHY